MKESILNAIIKNIEKIDDVYKLKKIYTITKLAVEQEKEGYKKQ